MFGIGTGELLLLLVLALLVLGPERMPKLARDVGRTIADLRRTSEELRTEFLEADKILTADRLLDVAAAQAVSAPPDGPSQSGIAAGSPSGMSGATQADTETDVGATTAAEPTETEFDREARLARERLDDPELAKEREARAKAEGWTIPTDDAGTNDRWG